MTMAPSCHVYLLEPVDTLLAFENEATDPMTGTLADETQYESMKTVENNSRRVSQLLFVYAVVMNILSDERLSGKQSLSLPLFHSVSLSLCIHCGREFSPNDTSMTTQSCLEKAEKHIAKARRSSARKPKCYKQNTPAI